MKSHARSERLFSSRCVCVGKDVSLENALVLPRIRRIIQRERSNNKAKKSYINNTFAHTLALLAVREVTLRRKKNGVRPLSKSFSLGCSGLRRSKVTSVYRKTSNASTSSGFHRERETEPFTRSIASPLSSCVLFLNKNTV